LSQPKHGEVPKRSDNASRCNWWRWPRERRLKQTGNYDASLKLCGSGFTLSVCLVWRGAFVISLDADCSKAWLLIW